MKKIYVLLLSAFSFIMLSGCNDWIELEPKDTAPVPHPSQAK